MHIPFRRFLFLFSVFCTASAQGLTGSQINIVKQRLQEGATHRSVYFLFRRGLLGSWYPGQALEILMTTAAPPRIHLVVLRYTRAENLKYLVGNLALGQKPCSSSPCRLSPSSRLHSAVRSLRPCMPPSTPLSPTYIQSRGTPSPRSLLRRAMARASPYSWAT